MKIEPELHSSWGHASARQLKRVPGDAGCDNQGILGREGEVLKPHEVCRAFNTVPHSPAADTSSETSLNEKLQAELPYSDDAIALHAAGTYPKHALLAQMRPENPLGV